jgi:SAM-dependent methyltransferase
MTSLAHNKFCELEDFADPELVEIIRDVFRHEVGKFTPEFPRGAEYRKYWEIAMSVRALRHFRALRPDSVLLGVAAGTETTLFYLTNHARLVFATDLYLSPGAWGSFAPGFMLFEPEKVAPYAFNRNGLIVQHMDGRILRYPDNMFDGIFSSGSIEHFGGLDFTANSAYEMGRVLKEGGILTVSTEYLINGPPGGIGWENCIMFSYENIMKYIVCASGLELVDEFNTHLSRATLSTQRELRQYVQDLERQTKKEPYPRVGEVIWSEYPHLVLSQDEYTFGSVHITLRKTGNYPAAPNEWAKPSLATLKAAESMAPHPTVASLDTVPETISVRSIARRFKAKVVNKLQRVRGCS